MSKYALTTGKIPNETEHQYTAWLLYCEYGSIEKLHRAWQEFEGRLKATERRPEFEELMERLGKSPALTSIKEWSSKFRWVERKDLKLSEDLQTLRERTKKIADNKKHKIGEALDRISNKVIKRLRSSEEPSIDEWKKVWEMFRTEMGESLGKHEVTINEDEQKPPTPEEMELGAEIDDAIENYYGRKGKTKK